MGFDWIDTSRADTFSPDPTGRHRLMVYVWYPTKPQSAPFKRSPYLPNAEVLAKKLAGEELEDGWGDLWRRVFSNEIGTDVVREHLGRAAHLLINRLNPRTPKGRELAKRHPEACFEASKWMT
jgi:hypothetical protein